MNAALIGRAVVRVTAWGTLVGVIVFAGGLPFLGIDRSGSLATAGVAIVVVLAGVYACWRAAAVGGPDARAWWAGVLALACFAVSATGFSLAAVFDLGDPVLVFAAAFGLGFRVLAGVAVASFPMGAPTARSRWRARLDLELVAVTSAYLAWGWVLSDLLTGAGDSSPAARAALFSVVDIVLVILVLTASLRQPAGQRGPARLVGLGLILLAYADWTVGVALSEQVVRTPPLAAAASIGAVALVAAGAWLSAHPAAAADDEVPMIRTRLWDRLPLLLAALAVIATLVCRHSWSDDPVLVGLAVLSVSSLLVWQLVVLLENEEMVDALAMQADRLVTIVNTAPVAIVEADREGRILLANPETGRLVGRRPEELVGRSIREELVAAGSLEGLAAVDEVLHGRTIRDLGLPVRRADGVLLDLRVSTAPVGRRGDPAGHIVLIGSDDGPRLRGLAALIEIERMGAFEQIANGIAHDFNNRLTVVLGAADLLLDQEEDPEDRELLEAITSAGRRAAALVDELVRASRSHASEPELFDLNEIVADLGPELERRSLTGIALDLDLHDGALPVCTNRGDLQQALINLVLNASEAMSPGGRVGVCTRWSSVTAEGEGSDGLGRLVELVVTDAGAGMAPEVLARILEPFFTTKTGTERSRGLGLSAVQGIVVRSDGDLQVESTVGVGTSMSVRLPVPLLAPEPMVVSQPSVRTQTEARPGAAAAGTILLVDDEAEVRAIASRTLAGAGYEVIEAASAEDAIALLEHDGHRVALLLTDVVMPGWSGIELGHHVALRHPAIAVLLMSGFVGGSAQAADQEVPFPLLSKPVDRSELLALVGDLVAARAAPALPSAGGGQTVAAAFTLRSSREAHDRRQGVGTPSTHPEQKDTPT